MLEISNYFCTNPECKDFGIRVRGNLNVQFSYGKHNRICRSSRLLQAAIYLR